MKKIVAKTGEYTNRDGQNKAEWTTIGVIKENDNGEYVLLDPAIDLAGVLMKQRIHAQQTGGKAGRNILCSVFAEDRQQQAPQQQARQSHPAPPPADDYSDDIPFNRLDSSYAL